MWALIAGVSTVRAVSENPWRPDAQADRGEPDPVVRAALAAAYDGEGAYARAVAALCTARLILPTVEAPPDAELGGSKRVGADDHPPEDPAPGPPSKAAVLLRSASGDKAVCVFTGADALHGWRGDARPVRCTLDDVAATVRETASRVIVVDVAGPHPLVIERPLIDELARGRRLVELPDGGFGWLWVDAAGGQPASMLREAGES